MLEFQTEPASGNKPHEAASLGAELRFTARLGIPLAIGELGWMSTYIVDALMIGRLPHSALSISASSLGNTIFYALAFCAIGLLTGLETLVAQSYGRGDQRGAFRTLAQSMWFTAAATPIVMGLSLAAIPLLRYFGTPPDIVDETRRYLHALIWSTLPLLLYWSLRRYLQSVDRVLLIMVSLITASMVNFVGDWAFLYGHLGLKPFGIAGSAWATCCVRVYTVILLLISVRLSSNQARVRFKWRIFSPDMPCLRALFGIGWPTALQSLADLGVSTFLSVACARLGATLLAAHQVVLDLNAFVYMVPLGLSYATITRVGQSAGRNSAPQVRRAAMASLLLGLSFILVGAALFVTFPRFWAGLYTNDSAAVAASVPIFLLCGFLQLGDGAGIILSGALVGLGDTRTPLIVDATWSWFIGMPLAIWLAFRENLGLEGLWTGRVVAAVGSAVMLAFFWYRRLQKSGKRLEIAFRRAAKPA